MRNKLPTINNAHGADTRNIINEVIKTINDRGLEILSESGFLTWLEKNGIKHREEVATFADLPSSDSLNTVRGVESDNKIYIKKENGWVPFQTIDINKISLVDEKVEDISLSVKSFGAIGDGITDDTQAIINGLNAIANGGELFFPKGVYFYNSTILINENMVISGVGSGGTSTLLYGGSGSAVDVDTSGTLKNIRITNHSSWDMDNVVSGIRVLGAQNFLTDIFITGFDIGIFLYADGKGCAYNQIYLRRISDCLIGVKIDSIGSGWVNENTLYGGRISIASELHTHPYYNDSWGVYMDFNGNHRTNNNKFISQSIESVRNGIRIAGIYNSFYHPRLEFPGELKVLFVDKDGLTSYNWIFGLYGLYDFGTHIQHLNEDGSQSDYLKDNTVFCRSSSLPLSITNSGIEFSPSYRRPRIHYNNTDRLFNFSEAGANVADFGRKNHNLYNQEVKEFVIESLPNRPTATKVGRMYYDTTLNQPIWRGTSGWVDAMGNPV